MPTHVSCGEKVPLLACKRQLAVAHNEPRRVPHVEQELPTLPQHISSSPTFSGVRVVRVLVFFAVFCRSLFFPLSFFFLLAIVMSVFL